METRLDLQIIHWRGKMKFYKKKTLYRVANMLTAIVDGIYEGADKETILTSVNNIISLLGCEEDYKKLGGKWIDAE